MRFFSKLHPAVEFIFFVLVIVITAFTNNPVIIGMSFFFALSFCLFYVGAKKLFSSLLGALPLMAVIALINPLFVHKGETILFFLNDNPVTKEAVLYGVSSSVMLAAVYYWCKAYNEIVTSDKFIYLFGRFSPKLALLLSLIIGFVPKLKRKYKEIDEAQKTLGVYSSGGIVDKLAGKFRVFSILLTDSLESSVCTADGMQSRGYGLKGRTAYSPYTFTPYDFISLLLILITGISTVALFILKVGRFVYYPTMSALGFGIKECVLYVCAFVVFAFPTIIEIKEEIGWNCLRSKI
mgnify:FL=1